MAVGGRAFGVHHVLGILDHVIVVTDELRPDLLDVPFEILGVGPRSELRDGIGAESGGVAGEEVDIRQLSGCVLLDRRDRDGEGRELIRSRLVDQVVADHLRIVFRRGDRLFHFFPVCLRVLAFGIERSGETDNRLHGIFFGDRKGVGRNESGHIETAFGHRTDHRVAVFESAPREEWEEAVRKFKRFQAEGFGGCVFVPRFGAPGIRRVPPCGEGG